MADIRVALVTLPWRRELLDTVKAELAPAEVICLHRFDVPGITRVSRRADVALLAGDFDRRLVESSTLRWVHCDHAGLDRSALPEAFKRGLMVTSAAGRSAPALAEHVMFFMLALSFEFGRLYEAQQRRRWGIRGQSRLRALYGRTLGIVGLGHIGTEIARRAKAFGMRVVAYRRRGDGIPEVDRVYSADKGCSLSGLLQESDFVALALPLSDQTFHLIGEKELRLMKPTAYLVNIARGSLINEAHLINALRGGQIAGAAIDVAEEEPLPADSQLWDTPNLLITPHVTPRLADRDTRSLRIVRENIRRYRADEPLLNQLRATDGFSLGPLLSEKQPEMRSPAARLRRLTRRLSHRWRIR